MMDKDLSYGLDGQVALVTGAGKGIGRACALALAQAGAEIILGLRDKGTGEALVQEIDSLNC